MQHLLLAALLLVSACEGSPTDPEPHAHRLRSMELLDDGSLTYLDSFRAAHPGADCRPTTVRVLRSSALVVYRCRWATPIR